MKPVFWVGCLALLATVGCNRAPTDAGPRAAITLTEANFAAEALQTDKPVLVDFYGENCLPCRQMAPIVEQLAKQYQGKAIVGKVNAGENAALSEQYSISYVPVFIVFRDGKEITRFEGGGLTLEDLEGLLQQASD